MNYYSYVVSALLRQDPVQASATAIPLFCRNCVGYDESAMPFVT